MKARRKFRESRTHAIAWGFVVAFVLFVFLMVRGVTSVFAVYNNWIADLPTLDSKAFNLAEDSYMYAADGKTLLAKFQLEKRNPVEMKDISRYAIDGTVATEDVRFYDHNGVDMPGILRAVVVNFSGGNLEGASTITQQLVRNTALSEEATDISFGRKAREAELALEMEKKYSKEEILNMYLNTINYGDGCYGIEAASMNYFQTHAKDLTLGQAALLAGIPQSPTTYNPKENPEGCKIRRNHVLWRMMTDEKISKQEYEDALKEEIVLNPEPAGPEQGIFAYPYFTSFVRNQLMQPDNQYGCSYADLFRGGLKIYTTLDVEMQDIAERVCAQQYNKMEAGLDAALVAMNPSNGHVSALVGGKDFYGDQWNIAVQGGRPTGSTFKAFTLAAAIENGMSPSSYIDCSNPVTLPSGQTINNFGNASYGSRTIDDATAISSNTGYYRLTEKIGVDKLIEMAHRLGITSELSHYPIITLGTENVTPLEMAEAYSTFADGGVHHRYVLITRIEDSDGEILYENYDDGNRVLEEDVAKKVTEVLRGVFEKSYATAYGAGPSNGQVVAGKTGTGVDYRDHWLVGYSPTLTCAAWIGNRDYSSTSDYLNANGLWHDFMSDALARTKKVQFGEKVKENSSDDSDDKDKTSHTPTEQDRKMKEEIASYSPGSFTEDGLTQMYPAYEVKVAYQYSDSYDEGTVMQMEYDMDKQVINAVVSQGKRPVA